MCCCLSMIFVIFWIISIYFLLYPKFHIKNTSNKFIKSLLETKPFRVWGHRGGSKEHPENTL